MKMNKNNKKALSAGLAVAILVTGTFAWQSYSQYALNKTSGPELTEEPGGRLHDDFDGDNKDVYVENFASEEDGIDVYARIRLDEYFEYGTDADEDYDADDVDEYGNVNREADLQVVRGDIKNAATPVRENVTTWDTYKFGGSAVGASDNMMFNYENADKIEAETETALTEENIRVYRDLAFGGSTSYLPTFNKDVWDKTADINGTYEGELGDGLTVPENRYSDYTKYTMGEPFTETAYISSDYEVESNSTIGKYTETHVVSKTESATVISMDDWKKAGSPVGAYWVYDVDGWAYYAKGISPQEASGLLLDNIQVITDPENNWFYAVNVIAQIATAGDWGVEGGDVDELGMYADGITTDGLAVLNAASGNTAITNVSITKAGGLTLTNADLNVTAGSALSLAADVSVYDGLGSDSEKEVVWTIEATSGATTTAEAMTVFSDGTFAPTTAMIGDTFKITATSKYNTAKSDSIIVTVVA